MAPNTPRYHTGRVAPLVAVDPYAHVPQGGMPRATLTPPPHAARRGLRHAPPVHVPILLPPGVVLAPVVRPARAGDVELHPHMTPRRTKAPPATLAPVTPAPAATKRLVRRTTPCADCGVAVSASRNGAPRLRCPAHHQAHEATRRAGARRRQCPCGHTSYTRTRAGVARVTCPACGRAVGDVG